VVEAHWLVGVGAEQNKMYWWVEVGAELDTMHQEVEAGLDRRYQQEDQVVVVGCLWEEVVEEGCLDLESAQDHLWVGLGEEEGHPQMKEQMARTFQLVHQELLAQELVQG
jgi:hypothetical protein